MNTKRWLTKRSGWAVAIGLLILAAAWIAGRQDEPVRPIETATPNSAQSQLQGPSAEVSVPVQPIEIGASSAASVMTTEAAIEYAAPWALLLHFETERERSQRLDREDPFHTAADLEAVMARAAAGDPASALRLHNLVDYCDQHPQAGNPPPGYLPLDCSAPKTWTVQQRRAWRQQAAFTGDPAAAMSMLQEADRKVPSDPERAALFSDGILSLDYAARRGCLECIVQLASLHHHGNRIQQDLPRAFAYLQVAAAASGDPTYSEHAAKIRPSLRPIDIEFARALQERLAKAIEKNKAR
ncbi:hypothetical protein PV762_15170 [Mitsuaria sp. CC2]|uniref:hypothetical protein n=1 Tax=Mitsuaria sp. CC2 TaxID=3029186 RepID=UPI003B8DBC9A